MCRLDDNAFLSITDLAAVTGGQAINFDQKPQDAIAQVNNRIATCRALGAEAHRLRSTPESGTFQAQAKKCWDSLRE